MPGKVLPLQLHLQMVRVFMVFSDKCDKPKALRLTSLMWDVKEPTHCSKRVGDVVPGVVVSHSFCFGSTSIKYLSFS